MNMLISFKLPLLPKMTCPTQRQCGSCFSLILPTLSKELILQFELIRTSLPDTHRNQVLGFYWLLNLTLCAATYPNRLLLSSLFTEETQEMFSRTAGVIQRPEGV